MEACATVSKAAGGAFGASGIGREGREALLKLLNQQKALSQATDEVVESPHSEASRASRESKGSQESKCSKESSQDSIDAKGRIFVAKIPRTVTEDEFKEYFSKFGTVSDAYMPKDRTQRYYRGIGFITFEDETSANQVMSIKHRFHDQDIVVDFALPPKKQRSDQTNYDGKTAESPSGCISEKGPPAKQAGVAAPCKSTSSSFPLVDEKANSCHGMNCSADDFSNNLLSAVKLSGVIPNREPLGRHVPAITHQWPQGHGVLDPMALGVHPPEAQSMAPCYGGVFPHDLGTGMRTCASRELSLDGSLRHSHSFASTTDMSPVVFDGSTEFLSSGTFSQDSDITHLGHNGHMGLKEISSMSSLSPDDLFQAFRDLPSSSPAQTLQELVAMRSATKRMAAASLHGFSDMGVSHPSDLRSSQTSVQLPGFESLDSLAGEITDVFLADAINQDPATQSQIGMMAFQKWQKGRPRIFLGCVPIGTTRKDLVEYFGQFGVVHDVYMPHPWDNTSGLRGCGFVAFRSQDAAQRVLSYGLHYIKNCPVTINGALSGDFRFI